MEKHVYTTDHQSFLDAKLVVDYLGNGSKAVSGAGCITTGKVKGQSNANFGIIFHRITCTDVL